MLLEPDSWEAWPADLELPSQHFVLFLAADVLNTPAKRGWTGSTAANFLDSASGKRNA
jgi:hypothetical protein